MDNSTDSVLYLANYKRDRYFRLYTPDYDSWQYTYYGDDLGTVETSLKLKWLVDSGDIEVDANFRRFAELAEYLEREGLFSE